MDVKFKEKIFKNFDKNPKARSEWSEEQIKDIIEAKMHFPTFSTKDLFERKIKLENDIKIIVDGLFKNKDMHSIDLFFVNENETKRKQRKIDKKFVENIINSGKPYNLGKFFRENYYHFHLEYDKLGNRIGIHLSPLIFFVEVKSFLESSKPPVISITEAYKINYALNMGLPILIAFVKINLNGKKAEISLVLVKEFKGIGDKWFRMIPEENQFPSITVNQLSKFARKPLPLKIENKSTHIDIQFLEPKNEIKVSGELVLFDEIQIIEDGKV